VTTALRPKLYGWLSLAARYLLGFCLVYWLVHTEVLDFRPLASISAGLIAQGVLLGASINALSAFRIQYLLRDQNIRTSYGRCFIVNCIGLFYSLFLPGGVSGDAARAYYFFNDAHGKRIAVVGALLLDRLLGLITLIGFGILSGLFLASVLPRILPWLAGFSALLAVLVIGLVIVIRYELQHRQTPDAHVMLRLWEKARGTFAKLRLHDYSTRTLILSMILSALMNVLAIALIYLCSVLNGAHLGLMEVSAVSPLGLLTNAIPLSPGGLGIGEKSFDMLYKAIGGEKGAGSFLTARVFLYSPALLGGLVALWFLVKVRHPHVPLS
jgi:glycosyltransferase 2 family protein